MPNPTVGPELTIDVGNQVPKKENQKYFLRYLVMPNLAYMAAPNAIIDGIGVIHMERRLYSVLV